MRRTAALALLAGSLLAATPALAARGVNLSWSRCAGEGLGSQLKSFACDTNAGSEQLVVSFVLDAPIPQVSGNEIVIDLISQDDPMPAWWDMKDVGTCRQASLAMNTVEDPGDVVCADWASGQSGGGIGSYNSTVEFTTFPPDIETRHRRLKMALAVPLAAIADLAAGVEYFSCNVTIDHAKTAGAGACTGCAGQVCLVLNALKVTTALAQNDLTLSGGATAGSEMAHWQGSGADCRVVPVRNRSWSQVKALYR
jgi:hypothetical protein